MAKMKNHVHIRSFVFFVYLVHLMLYAAALIYLAISNKHSLSDFIQTKELTYLVYVKFGVFFLCTYFCCMEYRKLTVGLFYLAHALDMVLSLAIIVIHCLTVDREKAYYVIVMVLVICHNSFMVLVDVLGLVTLCMSVRSGNSADRYKSSLPSELKDCYLEQNYTRKKKNKKKEKKNRQSEDLGFNRKGYFDTFDDVADGRDDAVVGVSYDKKNGTTKTDPFIRDPCGNPLTLEISPNGSQSPLIADEIEFAATPGNEEPPHPRESLKRHHRVVGTPSMHVKAGRRSTKKESTTIENLHNHERLLQEQQQRQQEIEMTARNQADQHETVENQTHHMRQNSQQIEQQSQHTEQQIPKQNPQTQQLRMAPQLKKHPASERQPRKVYKHERRLSQQFSVEQLRNELRTTPQVQQQHSATLQQPTVTLQNSTTRTRSLSQSAYTLQQPLATPQDSTTRTRSISQSAYRLPSSETVEKRERRYSQQMDDIRQLKELQLQQQAQMQQMQMLLLQHQQNQILQQQQQQQNVVQQQSLPSATPPPPPPPLPPVAPQEAQQPPPTYSIPQRTAQQATPQHPPAVSQTSHVSNSSQQPPNFIPPPPPANPPAVKPKRLPPPPPSAPLPPPPSTPPPPLTKQDSHPPYFTPEKDYPEESDQSSFAGRRSTTHSRRNSINQNPVATRQRRHSIEVGSLNSGPSVVNKYVKQYNRRLSQQSDSFRISNTFKKQSNSSQDVRILARTTSRESYTQDTRPTTESGYGSFERPYMERTSSFDNLVARTSHIY